MEAVLKLGAFKDIASIDISLIYTNHRIALSV